VTVSSLDPVTCTDVGSSGHPLLPHAVMYIRCGPFHAASGGGKPGDVHCGAAWPGANPSE
jgi:hypothetical protein